MIYLTSRLSHISPFLRQLHWLNQLTKSWPVWCASACMRLTGPATLADELSHSSDFESRRRLCSASSPKLVVRQTGLFKFSNRTVVGPRLCNSLRPHVTSAS